GIERIAQLVLFGQLDEALDELIVSIAMDVDALDGAARLAGVEHRAVNQVLDSRPHRRVGPHVGRVFAAEFQPRRYEPFAGGPLPGVPARHRSGESDEADA